MMKRILILLLVLAMTLTVLAGCNENNTTNPTDASTDAPTDAPTDKPTEEPTEEPTDSNEGEEDDWAEYDTITIAEALELCGEPGNLTTERYYIRATIISVDNPQYGQMTIGDETGTIMVYGTYSADGEINY